MDGKSVRDILGIYLKTGKAFVPGAPRVEVGLLCMLGIETNIH